jgi:nicotinamidase-related amidase
MSAGISPKNNGPVRHPVLANPENIGLVVVDVQEKFTPVLPEFDRIVKSIVALVRGFQEFGLPVIRTEQYPAGLGKTVPAISDCFQEAGASGAVEKMTFSAMQVREFTDSIKAMGVESFVVCGIETHICVHQTVCDMLHAGYRIWVPWDAVGSRDPKNRDVALGRMEKAGAILSSTEMLLFEMAMRAGTESFKKIQGWIK